VSIKTKTVRKKNALRDLYGIWEGRDINLSDIRKIGMAEIIICDTNIIIEVFKKKSTNNFTNRKDWN